MPDFATTDFPEAAFPPAATTADSYRRTCARGSRRMAQLRVAITGLARNLGHVLPATMQRVEQLCGLFADARVVVYENDSTDDTKRLLEAWAAANRRVHVTLDDCHDPKNPPTRCLARAERMARYRDRCQQVVLDRCAGFDAVIVLDLDVAGGFSLDGVANSFGHDDWDFIGSNGLIFRREGLAINSPRQYDMWALRFDADLSPLSTKSGCRYAYTRGQPLVPVTSCFGGMGIYRMDAYQAGRYGASDTEHAIFHRELIERGFGRLFLNPSQILVYGRRHRFGDPFVAAALRAWSRCTGSAAEPWICGTPEPVRTPARNAAAA